MVKELNLGKIGGLESRILVSDLSDAFITTSTVGKKKSSTTFSYSGKLLLMDHTADLYIIGDFEMLVDPVLTVSLFDRKIRYNFYGSNMKNLPMSKENILHIIKSEIKKTDLLYERLKHINDDSVEIAEAMVGIENVKSYPFKFYEICKVESAY